MCAPHVILIVLIAMVFSSCGTEKGCSVSGPIDESFGFRLLDKNTNERLIGVTERIYNSEAVLFLDQNQKEPPFLNIGRGGNINFLLHDSINEALNKSIIKKYYLHLPDKNDNPSSDIDTLCFEYCFEETDDCPAIWYKRFVVKYNDSIYIDGQHQSFVNFLK